MASDRRAIDDHRRRTLGHDLERLVAFVCERVEKRCRRAVLLTAAESDKARASNRALVVDASHLPSDGIVPAR
jgi:hypothetical protein